jgi:hypothetical protein
LNHDELLILEMARKLQNRWDGCHGKAGKREMMCDYFKVPPLRKGDRLAIRFSLRRQDCFSYGGGYYF